MYDEIKDDLDLWKTGPVVVLVFASQTSQTWDAQKNLRSAHSCIGRGMCIRYGSRL